jgi:hypothetical protein
LARSILQQCKLSEVISFGTSAREDRGFIWVVRRTFPILDNSRFDDKELVVLGVSLSKNYLTVLKVDKIKSICDLGSLIRQQAS